MSLKYVQVRKALDRPSTLKEFGGGSFYYLAPVLDPSLDERWANDRTTGGAVTAYQEMKARVDDVRPTWATLLTTGRNCSAALDPRSCCQ